MAHPRRPAPRAAAERLAAASAAYLEARKERDAAIVDAVKAGASLASVAELVGMSKTRVHEIAKAGGWTAAAFHATVAEQRQAAEEFSRFIGDNRRSPRQATDPKK